MSKNDRSFSLALTLVAALTLTAWSAPAAIAARPVATAVAAAGGNGDVRQLDGTLEPVRQATLAAQVGGSVLSMGVKAGEAVRKGQVIARVDDRNTRAAVLQADAGVAQAQAALRQAQLQMDRTRQLQGQGFVSQSALDQAKAQLDTAQAAVRQAGAGREQARLAQGFTTVTAPYDAVVLSTHAEPGDLAGAGSPLATVYVPGAVRAVVQVPASMSASARQAQAVTVVLPDGRRLTPVGLQLLPTADPVSQTVEWRLNLPSQTDAAPLRPGEAVQVQWQTPADARPAPAIARGASAQVSVPAGAVLQRGELTAMYIAQGDRFVLRAVRTGAETGERVQVLAGLKPNERYALDAIAAGLADAVPAQ